MGTLSRLSPWTRTSAGATPAMLRPGAGPVAHRAGKFATWDILVCAKLDRITRSTPDFDDLLKWCKTHGKTLVSVAESAPVIPLAPDFFNCRSTVAGLYRCSSSSHSD